MVELDKAYYRNKHNKEHYGYSWGRNEEVYIGLDFNLGVGFCYVETESAELALLSAYDEAENMVFLLGLMGLRFSVLFLD